MTKQTLTFREFATKMMEQRDLDPDYIFINNVCHELELPDTTKANWIALKTIIYHSVSELEHIMHGVPFTELKFGNERQKQKMHAEKYYQNILNAAGDDLLSFFQSFAGSGRGAMQKITNISGYGSWAAWKLMDLCSCCLNIDIDFSDIDFRQAYEYPLKGLLMLSGLPEETRLLKNDQVYEASLNNAWTVLGKIKNYPDPCNGNRFMNIQEVETLLCKYHSYMHGHYKIGEDVERLRKRIKECKFENIQTLLPCAP